MRWQFVGLGEGRLDAVEDFQVVFAKCQDVAADAAEDFTTVFTSKTTRYLLLLLLLLLRHPDVALTLVVIEWDQRVCQKCQGLRFIVAQSIK